MEQCGGIVEQCWLNSGTVMVEQWNGGRGTVEQCLWNSVMEQCSWNSEIVMVEECDGTVEQCWWNSGTVMVEQWKSDGEKVW